MIADQIARDLAAVDTVRTSGGTYVRMDGKLAVVNVGASVLRVPVIGWVPPIAGMPVRIQWTNGSPELVGTLRPLNPIGVIKATGTPKATVTVDGVDYMLFLRDGYTPAVGHTVEINWQTQTIQGRVTGVDTPTPPPENAPGTTPFDVTILAAGSGRYQPGSGWWSNDPWASNSNVGIWTFGDYVKQAVGAGATIEAVAIFLPLIQEAGSCSIGVHAHPALPGGAPTITSLIPLSPRGGWVALPINFGTYLALGGTGIGVVAPTGGNNQWRGTASNSQSGAIRIVGKR